jgi:hypothetical protein
LDSLELFEQLAFLPLAERETLGALLARIQERLFAAA